MQLQAAMRTKMGMRRRIGAAARASRRLARRAATDDKIADIRNPGERVGKDKNRIAPPEAIGEQAEGTNQAKPPKRVRDNHLFAFFRNVPLNKKPGKENEIPGPTHDFPEMPFDPEIVGATEQLRQHFHGAIKPERRD